MELPPEFINQNFSIHQDLREKLYTLGFHQQLPIGSMSIVSALLEDLIKVTDSYKQSKETVKNLLEVLILQFSDSFCYNIQMN